MITPVVMPQLGLEMSEGTVAAIHVQLGAEVVADQPLLELETEAVISPEATSCRTVEIAEVAKAAVIYCHAARALLHGE